MLEFLRIQNFHQIPQPDFIGADRYTNRPLTEPLQLFEKLRERVVT
ncbi:MAG: hypothetical protein J7J17_02255 [Hadesarchaea archaeon]|nr:hypothetical protein [Hadesarchaea archaeon]